MSDYIKLTFLTNQDLIANMNIIRPDTTVPDSIVKTAMQEIIASGAIRTTRGKFVSPLSAELITITETRLL